LVIKGRPAMNKNESQSEMQCSQFEALLADALDQIESGEGVLSAGVLSAFEAHGRTCAVCGPLLEETREGMRMLRSMEMVEPPRNLVHNILAATSREGEEKVVLGSTDAPRAKSALLAAIQRSLSQAPVLLRTRFATSFLMAFFSLSITLGMMGVTPSKLSKVDWHPTALWKSGVLEVTQLESRVQRYYDNMRLVYKVEASVKNLKKAASSTGSQEQEEDNNNKN